MIKIFHCRRSSLALIGMFMLFIFGLKYPGVIQYVAVPISLLAGAVAAANAYEGKKDV